MTTKNTNGFNLSRKSIMGMKVQRPTAAETFRAVLSGCYKKWDSNSDFSFTFNPASLHERYIVFGFIASIKAGGGTAEVTGNTLIVKALGTYEHKHIAEVVKIAKEVAALSTPATVNA